MLNAPPRSRQILIHGLFMVMTGLLWGVAIPHTPFPRLALSAHIQFLTSGIIYLLMSILLFTLPHRVGPRSTAVMLLSVWLTWGMATSEAFNSFWGTTHILPIVAAQARANGGTPWQENVETVAHVVAALGLLASWGLLVVGFVRGSERS
jgi:hydroxylaminobenzene mutase